MHTRGTWLALMLAAGAVTVAGACSGDETTTTTGPAGSGAGSSTGGGGSGAGSSTGGGGNGAECGNNTMEQGEECDDGNTIDADGCEADCTNPRCNNGIVDPGELCFLDAAESYPTQGESERDMVLVDCDGDGDMDVITAGTNSGTVTMLTNDGAGVLAMGDQIGPGNAGAAVRIALAEMDGDSGAELVMAYSDVGVGPAFNYRNIDGCSFAGGQPYVGLGGNPFDVAVVRFDGDQLDDPVATVDSNPNPTIRFVDTAMGSSITSIATNASEPVRIAAGDLTGNGEPDLVMVDTASANLIVRTSSGIGFDPESPVVVGVGVASLALGDIDGDNDLDVVVANGTTDSISVLDNDGGGTLTKQATDLDLVGASAEDPRDIILADIDMDGDLDILTANANGIETTSSVSIFFNDGTGSFTHAESQQFPQVESSSPIDVDRQPYTVRVADLNGDGAPDLITSSAHVENNTSLVTVRLARP